VGLRKIIHAVRRTDCDGGGELAPLEAIEEEEPGHVSADGPRLKTGERGEAAIAVGQEGESVVGKVEDVDAVKKPMGGVAFPAPLNAGEEAPPGFMVLLRILVVRL